MEMTLVDIGNATITEIRGGALDGTRVLVIQFLTGNTPGDHCSLVLQQAKRLCHLMRSAFKGLDRELVRTDAPVEKAAEPPVQQPKQSYQVVARRVRVRNVFVGEPTQGPYDGTPFIVLHLLVSGTRERLTYALHHETAAEFLTSLATELEENGCNVKE